MYIIHRAVGIGVIGRILPVAGFLHIAAPGQHIRKIGQGVDVVFQIQAVGKRVVQGILQSAHAVSVVIGAQGVKAQAKQHLLQIGVIVQHILQQIVGLLQAGPAERQILPCLAAHLRNQCIVKMRQAAVTQNHAAAGGLFKGAQPGNGGRGV